MTLITTMILMLIPMRTIQDPSTAGVLLKKQRCATRKLPLQLLRQGVQKLKLNRVVRKQVSRLRNKTHAVKSGKMTPYWKRA